MIATSPLSSSRPATTSSNVPVSPSSNVAWGTHVPSWEYATRTAPIGPSNGMPLIMSAADDALIANTSCGLTWSAPITVTTIWVSLRKPSGNAGRNGRSIRRQVKMACWLGRPSRRKNEPGIFPAAYARSSTSTVSGKKSMPSRTPFAALAVTSTVVFPIVATTAPCDCSASFPVSNRRVLSEPLTAPDTEMASAMCISPMLC